MAAKQHVDMIAVMAIPRNMEAVELSILAVLVTYTNVTLAGAVDEELLRLANGVDVVLACVPDDVYETEGSGLEDEDKLLDAVACGESETEMDGEVDVEAEPEMETDDVAESDVKDDDDAEIDADSEADMDDVGVIEAEYDTDIEGVNEVEADPSIDMDGVAEVEAE
jgi:hypothetical protein